MEKYLINPNHKIARINKDIYGHFSEHLGRCIYEGMFVGEDSKIPNVNGMRKDVINALKEMGIPVLRWPGGCFADEYHWKDGIGDKNVRKKMINTHWGGVVEDNSFGTHEYFELCRQLGCDTYVNGNVGSGSVREMSEWVEYITFDGVSPMSELRAENGRKEPWKLDYIGVGNENWGCGGCMDPEYYGCLFKRYNTYCRDYKAGEHIKRIACGPGDENYHWTREVMDKVKRHADGISLHYYTVTGTWEHKGSATDFDGKEYDVTISKAYKMESIVNNHLAVMDSVNRDKRVQLVIDEWGTWFDVEPGTNPGFLYQQNTMRDAIVAALTLNIFNKHADRIMMANIAQTVNVLQSVILTDGKEMVKTPTYYVFKLFKEHQNNTLLGSYLTTDYIKAENNNGAEFPHLIESASIDNNGVIYSTVANTSRNKADKIRCQIADRKIKSVKAEIITGDIHAKNDFGKEEEVKIEEFTHFRKLSDGFSADIPPCSVIKFTIE